MVQLFLRPFINECWIFTIEHILVKFLFRRSLFSIEKVPAKEEVLFLTFNTVLLKKTRQHIDCHVFLETWSVYIWCSLILLKDFLIIKWDYDFSLFLLENLSYNHILFHFRGENRAYLSNLIEEKIDLIVLC